MGTGLFGSGLSFTGFRARVKGVGFRDYRLGFEGLCNGAVWSYEVLRRL